MHFGVQLVPTIELRIVPGHEHNDRTVQERKRASSNPRCPTPVTLAMSALAYPPLLRGRAVATVQPKRRSPVMSTAALFAYSRCLRHRLLPGFANVSQYTDAITTMTTITPILQLTQSPFGLGVER